MTLTLRWKWRKTSTCLNWHTWRYRRKYPGFLCLKNARKFTDAQENLEGASFAHTFWSGFVDTDVWCSKKKLNKKTTRNKNTWESENCQWDTPPPLGRMGGCSMVFPSRFEFLHPGNLTWPLKRGLPKRKLVFQPSFFRGYVKFRGCTTFQFAQRHWSALGIRSWHASASCSGTVSYPWR